MEIVANKYESSQTDEALMKMIQKAPSTEANRAFHILYERYGEAILNYFYRMLWQNREKSEDFVHDLFSKVYAKSHQFDVKKQFKTWLYSIANNMCKNEYKKQEVRKNMVSGVDEYTEIVGDQQNSAQTKTHLNLFKEEFQKALDELDEKHSKIFALRHLQGLTIKEIAQSVSISEGTVKSRLFNATKRLAKNLAHFKTEIG